MSRRNRVRTLLMGPRKKSRMDHPWAMPLVLAAILALGIGIGVGVGVLSRGKPAMKEAPPAPVTAFDDSTGFDRPARHELLSPSQTEAWHESAQDEIPAPSAKKEAVQPRELAFQPGGGQPAWLRYAVPAQQAHGKPMIAVMIDDLGLDRRRTERVIELPKPLTLAFMTYAEDLDRQTAEARAHGHELMVHMPMQPINGGLNAGPNVLEVGLPQDELKHRIERGLSRFSGFVGINNHMGSRFTADAPGMAVVMDELARHGLIFVDSVTTDHSAAGAAARKRGVPFAARDVFLDNEQETGAVAAQLEHTEALARRQGAAIAIGHPHDTTIEALAKWLPTLAERGFVLVPVTAIVKTISPTG